MRPTQFHEENIIDLIFDNIGTTNKYFVDIGSGEQWSNTDFLNERGWTGKQLDKDTGDFITADNVQETLAKYEVPTTFDFLSLDIDGNDYWVLDRLRSFTPRVICLEFNAEEEGRKTIKYNPDHVWKGDSYFGATLEAFVSLCNLKGYDFFCQVGNTNAFFIHESCKINIKPTGKHKKGVGEWVEV